MRKLISLIRLIRLHNCLLAGVGVWMGWYLTSFETGHTKIKIAAIAAALVCAAGNALNDYLDIEADRLNHPGRPLPQGDLPPYIAVLATIVLNIAALILGVFVNMAVFGIIGGAIVLLILYNFKLKKMPLAGNLAVSILGGATFIVGGLAGNGSLGPLPGATVPAVFALLFHLGRELVKDMADLKGDLKERYRTLATLLSYHQMMAFIFLVFAVLILMTLAPLYYGWYQVIFTYIVIYAVDLPLLAILIYLAIGRRENRFNLAGTFLKLLMLLGLIAFYLGKF